MQDYFFRTEDIQNDDILDLFVETKKDREIVDALKGRNPILLLGSRGVGKSFLLKVAQIELLKDFEKNKVLPVYLSFTKSSLLQSSTPNQFHYWMLARICAATIRALMNQGLLVSVPKGMTLLSGDKAGLEAAKEKIEVVAEQFENSWKTPDKAVDISKLPDVDRLKDLFEDLCTHLSIRRFSLFIDEAAHIFLPAQQRQFFTLFRDLRSPYIACNAAVYPGVTSFGSTFQPTHDATVMSVERDVTNSDYIDNMREIVQKQAESSVLKNIEQNGQNFAVLAYAASGNPRVLLKTVARASKLSSKDVNDVIREYYRNDIWSEHSLLVEKYKRHKDIIDWGRKFIENELLPEIRNKNSISLSQQGSADKRGTSSFFWVHRDAPVAVTQALKILSYTGIVVEHSSGMKATRSEIGTRYMVNLGCLFASENLKSQSAFSIAKSLDVRRMTEFGAHHSAFASIADTTPTLDDENVAREELLAQLSKSINVLDISPWQKESLLSINLKTIGDILNSSEADLKKAYYVGDVRSRRMRNAAFNAVYEYLSG